MLKHHNYSLGLAWLVILFIVPLPLIQTLSAGLPAIYANQAQPIYLGSIAYSWMLTSIYLATRPKWLDRLIGLPDIYIIHGIISIFAIGLAYLHKFGTASGGWIKTTGDWAIYLLTGIMVYSLVFMAGWLTSRVPILLKIKQTLETVFKHEISVWLHRLNLVATGLVFIHVQLISYITAIHPFMFFFYAYSAITLLTYGLAKVNNHFGEVRGMVETSQTIAPNVQELTIVPNHHSKIDIRIGDFIFISFPQIKGLREYHPFSIVNIPSSDNHKIVLAVRGDGDFTQLLAKVSPKSIVKLNGGYGRYHSFLQDKPQDAKVVLIAGGIGVTPLLSIAEDAPHQDVTMFYSASHNDNLIYVEKLKDLTHRDHFTLNYQVGRYGEQDVLQSLLHHQYQNTFFLVSGPSPMIHYWKRTLKKNGIKSGQIYAEEFTW